VGILCKYCVHPRILPKYHCSDATSDDIVVVVFLYHAPLPPFYVNREHMINSSNLLWRTHWPLWVRARSSCPDLPACETAALRVTPLTNFPFSKSTLRYNILLFGPIPLSAGQRVQLPSCPAAEHGNLATDLTLFATPTSRQKTRAIRAEFSLLRVLTQWTSHWSRIFLEKNPKSGTTPYPMWASASAPPEGRNDEG
jgi:hypothetical protein